MKRLATFITSFLLVSGVSNAQLTVTTGLSNSQLETLLTGLGVTITNVQVNCHSQAYGEFSGTSEIPITHGLMMTTGMIDSVILGPNTYGGYGSALGYPGDATLDAELVGNNTFDACVIEFDCIPLGDTLEFNFGFGSEEYPEFVNMGVNDIFGIYISDSISPTPVNIAYIPGTTMPVSIDNLNADTNSIYYIPNDSGQYIQYDGITQNLHAFAVVVPGNNYHFKIAIADVGDGVWDSGVLLEAFSFRSTPTEAAIEDNILSYGFAVYPNPANDYIQLQSKLNLAVDRIEIADELGRIMVHQNIQSTSSIIDVSELPAGMYMLTGYTLQGKFTKKIFVQ